MSEKIKKMFASIAGNYDLMNNLLSLGIHKKWRSVAVDLSIASLGMSVLDCAAGTGDLSIQFKKTVSKSGTVIATDFCDEMLIIAKKKFMQTGNDIEVQIADATNLQFEDNSFDISSIAFGIRNVDSIKTCLNEMSRVVKSRGQVVILEFGQPEGIFKYIYKLYSRFYMPIVGKIIAKSEFAYDYLQDTAGKFPCKDEFVNIMKSTGRFSEIKYTTLSLGIAYIYFGTVK